MLQAAIKINYYCCCSFTTHLYHLHTHTHTGAGYLHCTDQYTLYGTFCYRYFGLDTKGTYQYAQKQCSRHRSALVSIYSPPEEAFVVQLTDNNTAFWIGLEDLEGPQPHHREGIFKWSPQSVLTERSYANWKLGEPSNKKHLDCVKADCMGWSMAGGGCASTKLPFICKKQGDSSVNAGSVYLKL